jgi:hypothetical protein
MINVIKIPRVKLKIIKCFLYDFENNIRMLTFALEVLTSVIRQEKVIKTVNIEMENKSVI